VTDRGAARNGRAPAALARRCGSVRRSGDGGRGGQRWAGLRMDGRGRSVRPRRPVAAQNWRFRRAAGSIGRGHESAAPSAKPKRL